MIQIGITGLDGIEKSFIGTPGQIGRAAQTASRRTADFYKGRIATELAADTRLKRSILSRYRLYAGKSKTGDGARVWLGFGQVKAAYVGPLRPTLAEGQNQASYDWGASAGDYLFPGAFVARMKSGHKGIFMRRGKSRLHIDEQGVSLLRAPGIALRISPELEAYWHKRFAENLNYQTNVRSGGDE